MEQGSQTKPKLAHLIFRCAFTSPGSPAVKRLVVSRNGSPLRKNESKGDMQVLSNISHCLQGLEQSRRILVIQRVFQSRPCGFLQKQGWGGNEVTKSKNRKSHLHNHQLEASGTQGGSLAAKGADSYRFHHVSHVIMPSIFKLLNPQRPYEIGIAFIYDV